jgi:hypothetical protein
MGWQDSNTREGLTERNPNPPKPAPEAPGKSIFRGPGPYAADERKAWALSERLWKTFVATGGAMEGSLPCIGMREYAAGAKPVKRDSAPPH